MTLDMPDSTDVAALPPGYGQYLGYVDGSVIRPTMPELRARFPRARLIGLTVTGSTFAADGCDSEREDLTAKGAAQWARQKLNRQPGSRPVIYASIVGDPGYGMPAVLTALAANDIGRDQVRLLSAHYGAGEHICGPATCGLSRFIMDGTQWTDHFSTADGAFVDMSVLDDGFFGDWTEEIVGQLPVVRQGDSGEAVRTVQGLILSRGPWAGVGPIAVDGAFGPKTEMAVRAVQLHGGIAQDGIVGPLTWPVLLGIA